MTETNRTRVDEFTEPKKYTDKLTGLIFSIYIVSLPILWNICHSLLLGKELLIVCTLLFCSIIYAGTAISKSTGFSKQKFINISYADISIVLFSFILVFNSIKNGRLIFIPVEEWCAILAVYLLMRNIRCADIIPETLILSGTMQSAIVLFQKTGYMKSNNEWFDITGSFGNPGPLGGFLAICIVICLCRIYETRKQNKIIHSIYIIAAGTMLTAFCFADSRAAFVATAAGCSFYFFQTIRIFLKKHPHIIPIIGGILILSSILIFNYRENSANGRLLIWRVCSEMICHKPFSGYGTASFGQDYMLHQAHYFETHPDSRFSQTADDTVYPFNEFLHILVELGIPGLSAIGAFLISLFLSRSKNGTKRILKAGLIAYLCFSLFSYPNSVFPLFVLFGIFSGCIKSRKVFKIPVSALTTGSLLILSVLVCFVSIREIRFYYNGAKTLEKFFTGNSSEAILFSDRHYEQLKYSESFNNIYSMWLEKHPDIKKLSRLPARCSNYCNIGKTYMLSEQYDYAEEYLKTASFMVPGKITPNYLLWQNSLQRGDTTTAITIAERILKQPLKAESTYTLRVKSEIRRFLETEQGKTQVPAQ